MLGQTTCLLSTKKKIISENVKEQHFVTFECSNEIPKVDVKSVIVTGA